MTLTDLFDRVAIINLPERVDRRNQIARELKAVGLQLSSPRVHLFEAVRPSTANGFPSIGARGCYLSHLAVLKKARQDGVKALLVMEDDLVIDKRLKVALPKLGREMQLEPWSILYLGHLGSSQVGPVRLEESLEPQQCLHCYAVHAGVMDELIAYLEACLTRPAGHPDGGLMHVDGAVTMFRLSHTHHRTLLVQPSMGAQRPSRSDITHNRWYDRAPLLRSGVGAVRVLKSKSRQLMATWARRAGTCA